MTPPNPLTIQQFDSIISSVADQIDEALEAGEEQKIPLLLKITEALEEQKAEKIDSIVTFLNFVALQAQAAKSHAKMFQAQAERLEAARDKIRVHIQNYIDEKLPEDNRRLNGRVSKLYTADNPAPSLWLPDPNAVPKDFYSYEMTVRFPAAHESETREAIASVGQFVTEFCPAGSSAEIRVDRDGNYKLILDEERVKQHLEANAEPWGEMRRGRHLRTKPSLAEAKRALVKA